MVGSEEPRGKILHKVADITLDIEALQVSLHTLVQKMKAIKLDLYSVEDDGSEQISFKSQPPDDQEQQPQTARNDDDRYFTQVKIPLALADRWAAKLEGEGECRLRAATSVERTIGQKKAKPKRVRWDSRWQDLFDSNEQESKDDADPIELARGTVVARASSEKAKENHSACMLHPHSMIRVFWDMLGLLMIVFDTISIPINTAWDFDLGTVGTALLVIGTVYWSMDIGLSFNTGFFKGATYISSRAAVAVQYLRTWLCADVFLVSLDLVMLVSPEISGSGGQMARGIRAVRIVRLARGLRLLKLSKVFLGIEYIMNVYGGNPAFMAIAIIKTLGSIYLLAHLACCTWYFLGRETGQSDASWLDLVSFDDSTFPDQYIRSCYWVLGHLTAAPVDPTIFPQNPMERSFTLLLIMSSLLVIGIAISKMSDTVAILNRATAEANDTKRTLQAYLHAHRFPADLSVRIVRHALAVHKKRAAAQLNPFILDLLSSALVSDINAWQRRAYLNEHPLFILLADFHPEVIRAIYSAFTCAIYADTDTVYKVGTLSEILYITTRGAYALHYYPTLAKHSIVTVYDDLQFFCEVSLFAKVRHRSTLKAITFADSLFIHSMEFVNCIRLIPSCIGTMYKYARWYLRSLVEVPPLPEEEEPVQPLEGDVAIEDVMPSGLAQQACDVARGLNLPLLTEIVTPCVEAATVYDAIDCIIEQDLSTEEIIGKLELAFPEVEKENGLYTQMEEPLERKRSIGAMLGLIWLTKDSYESFTESQKTESQMTHELWGEWQRFIQWTDPNRETLHALFFLLCIRGLGKAKTLGKIVPPIWRTPENTVLYLLQYAPEAVPSVSHLSKNQFNLVKQVLETYKNFNLAQLMQGENTPYQVMALKACIDAEGEALLKFYLLCLVGMMCGLTGAVTTKGCLFMDENNAKNVLSCIECLESLKTAAPHAIYWSYLSQRARWLGVPVNSPDDLAFARLACLTRASASDCIKMQETWSKVDPYDRILLVDHFLADGIHERAFLLSFLPVYLVNAKNNRVVGLYRGLLVLIDLIMMLKSDGIVNNMGTTMVVVNLSDVASFTSEAINSRAFESLVEQSNITPVSDDEVRVNVGAKQWQASIDEAWRPDQVSQIAHEVRRMSRTTQSVLTQQAQINPIAQCVDPEQILSPTVPSVPRKMRTKYNR